MSKATEMLNLVKEYRNDNEQIINEVYDEAIRRIREAASEGKRECCINTWSIGGRIPSNRGKHHDEQYICDSIQECLWDKLRGDGFSLWPDMDIEWSRKVRW